MKYNKNKFKDFIGISIAAFILFLVIFIPIYFFGGALFSFLGLKYSSFFALGKFFIILFVIYSPLDFFVECFFKVLSEFNKNNAKLYNVINNLLCIFIMFFSIEVVDIFLEDIVCPPLTALLFSIIFYLFFYIVGEKLHSKLEE